MFIQSRRQTFRTREEAAAASLDPEHYRGLLIRIYGQGAGDESLWDDSYISEIEKALSTITEVEATVIRARLLGGHLDQVGALLGCTGERVRQLEGKALRKLRHPSRKPALSKLRLRLCQYPKQSKRGPRLPKPILCIHCQRPQDDSTRFPPCPVRIAELKRQTDAKPAASLPRPE
jgi:hypothetical protein